MNLKKLLGHGVTIHLKAGGIFYFKITGAGDDYISGYDDEYNELVIKKEDIYSISGEGLYNIIRGK
jgi:hypothetical protein